MTLPGAGPYNPDTVSSAGSSKVVFLGDFNVDLIMDGLSGLPEPDREIGCTGFEIAIGASSCITAAAYAGLGGRASVCGMSGNDELGAFMRARLTEAGATTDLVVKSAGVGTGITVNLVQGKGRIQVTYPGAMGELAAAHVPAAAFDGLRHLHVSGVYQMASLLPDVDGLLSRAADAGASTSLDCQWDPTEHWDRLDGWLARVDWLFVNEQEARSMTGESGPEQALRALALRTRCPVLKAGPAGAWVMDGEGRSVNVPALRVTVVDTIGAGDNFDAGFLFAALEKARGPADAARFANAAAARSCTFRGGTAAHSTYQDVIRFMERR